MTKPEPRLPAGWRTALPPLVAGALGVLGFAPVGLFPLLWFALGALFIFLCRAPDRRAAVAAGFFWGLGLFLAGVSWVFVSMHDFGGMPAPVAVLATLLFCAYLALFPAVVGAAFHRLRGGGALADSLLFAGLWAFSEWLRGTLFTGFPWLAAGYSQAPPSPLAGYAPLLGVYGVSLLTALLAAALVAGLWGPAGGRLPDRRSLLPLACAGLLLAGGALLREFRWTEPSSAPLRVALLQGNVAQDLKWRPERFIESMELYLRLAREHPATLTILPETALPAMFQHLPPEYVADLEALARARGGDLLLGSVVGDSRAYANAVVSVGSSPRQVYGKQHLVPFGEFSPPGFGWFIAMMHIPMSEFVRGGAAQPPLAVGGRKVALNICYEDVFGEEIAAALGAGGEAEILVNVSNTAWFGRSWAQPQHLQIAQMRALETGRPMLRATNTGMTAHVGADGRVAAQLDPFTRGALVVNAQGRRGTTPFMRWRNTPALLLALLAVAFAGWRRRTGRSGSAAVIR